MLWIRDARFFACFNAREEPGHIAAERAHGLEALLVFFDVFRREAVDHVPVLRTLMETLCCTREKAMDLLKIPPDLQPKILAML